MPNRGPGDDSLAEALRSLVWRKRTARVRRGHGFENQDDGPELGY